MQPIIYVARDIERALGAEPGENYRIVTNDGEYARSVAERYPGFVVLVKAPVPLDTFELLEKEGTAAPGESAILVFKSTSRIEELCAKNVWRLLNPPAALAEKIENKTTQADWLGELASLLPSFVVAPLKDIVWQKKPLIIQFAHAHTGEGTTLINEVKELEALQKKFPDRPVRASDYIKGPVFTCNVVAGNEIAVGNMSYQVTGMPPFTDGFFATVGNDWSLPQDLLNERHHGEFKDIAQKIGTKMRESGWRGLFGIDIVYDEERDQLKLIEINARQPASAAFESQLQNKFRAHGLVGSTIFEAHLAALTGSLSLGKQIEINDGAQVVQRVTKAVAAHMAEMSRKAGLLNKAGYATIPYPNTKPNSDLLRIQSERGIMERNGKLNKRGEEIVEILE